MSGSGAAGRATALPMTTAALAAGILAHRFVGLDGVAIPIILIAIAGGAAGLMGRWRAAGRPAAAALGLRAGLTATFAVAALALGWISAAVHSPAKLTTGQRDHRALTGRIASLDYTDFSTRLAVDILDSDLPQCRVLLSTRGCDYTLQAGDLVVWPAALRQVGTMGNPDEMDYAAYLLNTRGIRYQQHLPLSQLKRAGHAPTLLTRMETLRRHLSLMVFNSGLSPQAQRLTTALLLGDSGAIDKTTRQEFAAAGIAHILALSGLHVGLIALIIWWMLFPLDYLGLKKLRLGLTIIAITLFAVFTGLSPSVVRATVMTAVVMVSFIFFRRSSPFSALILAALIILVFSPSSLFGVGFQLSFITVAALLLFARVPQSLQSPYRWVNYLTTTILTSIIAMLATMVLSAYYFHSISLMSVLTNLFILPVMPLFMAVAVLFLLVTAAGLQWPILDKVVDGLYGYIHRVSSIVGNIPFSHIDGIHMTAWAVVICLLIMVFVTLWLYRRRYGYLLAAGGSVAVLLCHSLWVDATTSRQGLVVFNSFTSTPILYYDKGIGYLWTPDEEEPDVAAFSRHNAGFLARHGIDSIRVIRDEDSLRLGDALIHPPYALLMGRRIRVVGAESRPDSLPSFPLSEIIVTRRYHGHAARLSRRYPSAARWVLSGALPPGSPLHRECHAPGHHVHDLATQGALEIY